LLLKLSSPVLPSIRIAPEYNDSECNSRNKILSDSGKSFDDRSQHNDSKGRIGDGRGSDLTEVVVRTGVLIHKRSTDGKRSAGGKRSADDKIARRNL
jgi:hypothetical protein